jgi:hypothetical protein
MTKPNRESSRRSKYNKPKSYKLHLSHSVSQTLTRYIEVSLKKDSSGGIGRSTVVGDSAETTGKEVLSVKNEPIELWEL